jgi:glycosyltransferase involved in cell wall biosynthesis
MIIGYTADNYATRRTVINILNDTYYKKVWDEFSLFRLGAAGLNCLARGRLDTYDLYPQFNDYGINRVDLLHFFNVVSYGPTPWITTFETIVPRFRCTLKCHQGPEPSFSPLKHEKKIRKALESMLSGSCKRIIAISECNAKIQKSFLDNFAEYKNSIENKILVMHPPQKLLLSQDADKGLSVGESLRFMFVGASFFRKGGMELIETCNYLRERYNYPIELTIISSLIIDNYATKEGMEDIKKAMRFIQENCNWIKWFPQLPNHEVIKLMQQSHIGLLPTYADTYGYSVLEFQAAGCPVITTNVRALPEINNNDRGWLIEIPTNHLGEAIYTTIEQRLHISDLIRNGLKRYIHEIFADRNVISTKSHNALLAIKQQHSPDDYASKTRSIYRQALES